MEAGTWTTNDGRKLLISGMETSHLKSCCLLLWRHAEKKRLDALKAYLVTEPPESDGAYFAFMHEMDWITNTATPAHFLPEKYKELEAELKARGIKVDVPVEMNKENCVKREIKLMYFLLGMAS